MLPEILGVNNIDVCIFSEDLSLQCWRSFMLRKIRVYDNTLRHEAISKAKTPNVPQIPYFFLNLL
jgi:hypothetical protein